MTLDLFPGEARTEDPNRRYTTAEFMAWIKTTAVVDAWDVDVAADAESHHAARWFSLLQYEDSAGIDGLVQSWLPPDAKPWPWFRNCQSRPCPDYAHCARTDGITCGEDDCDVEDGIVAPRVWFIFCNPPFDDLEPWLAKAWQTIEEANTFGVEVRIAFVLPGDRNEQPHWQQHVEPYRDGRARRAGYELLTFNPAGRISYAKPGSNGIAVGSAFFPSALLVWRKA